MFKVLCGTKSLTNVVLATTMWNTLTNEEAVLKGKKLEEELRTTPEFWGDMIDEGSNILRYSGTAASALEIVDHIMNLNGSVVLDIRRQMVDEKKKLRDTPAGQEVRKEILRATAKFQREIDKTKKSMQAAIDDGNQTMVDKLARIKEENERKIEAANSKTLKLKDDFESIKREREVEADKMIEALRQEQLKLKTEAEVLKPEVEVLAAKHRQYAAELAKEKDTRMGRE